jgi:hypothetical protein
MHESALYCSTVRAERIHDMHCYVMALVIGRNVLKLDQVSNFYAKNIRPLSKRLHRGPRFDILDPVIESRNAHEQEDHEGDRHEY